MSPVSWVVWGRGLSGNTPLNLYSEAISNTCHTMKYYQINHNPFKNYYEQIVSQTVINHLKSPAVPIKIK